MPRELADGQMGSRASGWAPALATVALFGALALTSHSGAPRALFAAVAAPRTSAASISVESASGRRVGAGYAWARVAELRATSVLSLAAAGEARAATWVVDGESRGNAPASGLRHAFAEAGWHAVAATDASGAVATADVLVKYVRRNIYNLTRSEREAFLGALKTTYAVGGAEGRRRYGDAYKSAAELVAVHLRGAAARECDMWHDDASFVVKHVAFTLSMEESLRSVDGTVAVPYWDYTADAALDDWTSARLFDDDVLSPASGDRADHAIASGRFAFTPVARAETVAAGAVANAYGLLRSPWNVNPTPYVGRYRRVLGLEDGGYALPSAAAFVAAAKSAPSLAVLTSLLNGMLHGEAHVMLGGHWGLDVDVSSGNVGFLLSSKMLWRQGLARCPATCAADANSSACACACPASLVGEFLDARGVAHDASNISKAALDAAGVLAFTPLFASEKWVAHAVRSYDALLGLLCAVGTPGEMFTSAAPYDPAFWPLHGLADRAVASRRAENSDFDETWGYAHGLATVASDDHLVCDWTAVDAGGARLPACGRGECAGHAPDALLPFATGGALRTNAEFFDFMDPANADFPYVYDALL